MENKKRGRGRPKKYATEEERKEARKKQKTKYMLNKAWYCDVCRYGYNYTLAGKWSHLNSETHKNNEEVRKLIQEQQESNEEIRELNERNNKLYNEMMLKIKSMK